jgi:tartrate dehydrogenase/decarboxylase / D-malate dehydrogenase
MRSHRIAVIGGDGIGPEVIEAGCRVLDTLAAQEGGFRFDFERFDWGSEHYRRHGRICPRTACP